MADRLVERRPLRAVSRSDLNYESSDLFALPMAGEDRTPIVIANTPAEERMGEFSPDGHWIAYQTAESGQPEIVVRAFPESKGIVHVSTGGGAAPRWRADGKELYFVAPGGKMMAVSATITGATISFGAPVALFSTHIFSQVFTYQYAVAPDGRFLVNDLTAGGRLAHHASAQLEALTTRGMRRYRAPG